MLSYHFNTAAFWETGLKNPLLHGITAMAFPGGVSANAGDIRDVGSILELGRSPGRGHGNPLQYSYLENSMDRGAQRATVHGVAKSQT